MTLTYEYVNVNLAWENGFGTSAHEGIKDVHQNGSECILGHF